MELECVMCLNSLLEMPDGVGTEPSRKRQRVETNSTTGGPSTSQSTMQSRPQVAALKCGHMFHKICIGNWLRTRPECPSCQTPSLMSQMITVFLPLTSEEKICKRCTAVTNEKNEFKRLYELECNKNKIDGAAKSHQSDGASGIDIVREKHQLKEKIYEELRTKSRLQKRCQDAVDEARLSRQNADEVVVRNEQLQAQLLQERQRRDNAEASNRDLEYRNFQMLRNYNEMHEQYHYAMDRARNLELRLEVLNM